MISTGYYPHVFLIFTMNTRRSSRKKPNNCFEELSEAIDESKTIDIVEGSSVITEDTTTKVIDNVSELRNALQALENKTTAQYCNLEFSFRQVTDSITALHDSIADLHSHQNKSDHTDKNNANIYSGTNNDDDDEDDVDEDNNPNMTYSYVNSPTGSGPTPDITKTIPTGPNHPSNNAPAYPAVHKFWKLARDENLERHRFQSLIKDITLQDDSMHGLRLFYNKICHALHTSFKKHVEILPPFGKLAHIPNITRLLVPSNPDYFGCTTIRSVHDWFSASILNILFNNNVINKIRTPRAYHAIITHVVTLTMDGTYYTSSCLNVAPS